MLLAFTPFTKKVRLTFSATQKKNPLQNFCSRQANRSYKAVIVVLDNFKSHTSTRVRKIANRLGVTLLFISPYSPDLNPIEQIWKSIKRDVSVNCQEPYDYIPQCSYPLFLAREALQGVITDIHHRALHR
jgi:putative transposase